MYRITFLPGAEESFKKIDPAIQKRNAHKIERLSDKADKMIHHPLKLLPDYLRGLLRLTLGDYRLIYWVYEETKQIKIYEIGHRSKDYRFNRK